MSSVNTQNCDFNPEAFWGSIENISITLKMSRNTVGKCLQCLTQQKQDYVPPLIKVPMSQFIIQDNKMIKSMPSIYVMNKENYEIEVELVKQKLLNNVKKEN